MVCSCLHSIPLLSPSTHTLFWDWFHGIAANFCMACMHAFLCLLLAACWAFAVFVFVSCFFSFICLCMFLWHVWHDKYYSSCDFCCVTFCCIFVRATHGLFSISLPLTKAHISIKTSSYGFLPLTKLPTSLPLCYFCNFTTHCCINNWLLLLSLCDCSAFSSSLHFISSSLSDSDFLLLLYKNKNLLRMRHSKTYVYLLRQKVDLETVTICWACPSILPVGGQTATVLHARISPPTTHTFCLCTLHTHLQKNKVEQGQTPCLPLATPLFGRTSPPPSLHHQLMLTLRRRSIPSLPLPPPNFPSHHT